MKKGFLIGISIFGVFLVVVGIMWVNAFNGAKTKANEIETLRGDVYASLSVRYEKMGTFIDAISDANSIVTGYLEVIRDARVAFAEAIGKANVDASEVDEISGTIDGTFITLLSYMEDNPASYNTVNLYQGFLSEFSAATNVVLNRILEYNRAVLAFNNHIETFPNLLFVGNETRKQTYAVDNYNTTLPTFN